jgi:uncharacterized repeat protein (TIGR01451 family)
MSIAMDAAQQSVVGDPVRYTLTVFNNGPATATNVTVTDALPSGATFKSASSTLGTIGSFGSNIIASVGTMNPGDVAVITIVVTPNGQGTLTNSANVTSSEFDPNTSNNSTSATTNVVNLPGVIQFAQAVFSANENAGVATITVNRTGGTLGALAVNFAAINGSGLDGVNFRSTSGTLTFLDGQSSQTFTVPLIDDGQEDGTHTVSLLLGAVGSTVLGPQSTATLNVVNTDIDVTGPTVQDVQLIGSGNSITGVVLTFSKVLDATRASNTANYFIAAPAVRTRASRSSGGPVGIASVSYTPGGKTVLVTPSQPLAAGVFYEIAVNGSSSTGVTDVFGNLLNFNGLTGTPSSNFVSTFARGSNLTYGDSGNNSVNLRLTGGGVIDLFRAANGDGQVVRLIGTVPGRSTLSGSVRKLSLRSSGVTTLTTIQGLEAFGAVRSRLRTPPFQVSQQHLPAPQNGLSLARATVSPRSILFSRRPTHHFR